MDDRVAVESALASMGPGYRELFEQALAVFAADDRVRALWLSGSLAKGVADVGSDLDLMIAVADDDHESYAADWKNVLDRITPTLVARELKWAPGSFYSTNRDCLRLDVVAEPIGKLGESMHRTRLLVFDKDGDLSAHIQEPAPRPAPDLEKMSLLVEEAFRQIAIFPQAVVGREDWLLGVAGVGMQRQMLYDLFVEANQPLPPMGVKQWSARLTPEQRAALTALPGLEAHRDSVVTGMRATVEAWNSIGRTTLEKLGIEWPSDLATTVTDYFLASV